MKSTLVVLLVVLVASSAFADIGDPGPKTGKPLGSLNIYIDAMGVATMCNDGDAPFSFDGYTILSDSGVLPADVKGIWDNGLFTPGFPPIVGLTQAECLKWAEMSTTAFNYSEVTMEVKPATMIVGGCMNLGSGFDDLDQADGTFTYVDSAAGGSFEGLIIPEPATLSLLALGGLALIRRRR